MKQWFRQRGAVVAVIVDVSVDAAASRSETGRPVIVVVPLPSG